MKKNILEYLEDTVKRYPDRPAYKDPSSSYSFVQVWRAARAIGSRIGALKAERKPIAVLMEKSPAMIVCLLGVVYGGSPYCPIDVSMPLERIRMILAQLRPAAMIVGRSQTEKGSAMRWMHGQTGSAEGCARAETGLAVSLGTTCPIYHFEQLCQTPEDGVLLEKIRKRTVDTDPLYILFTSGSTGIPKGVIVSHRVIINNMEWLETEYELGTDDVMGNQAPLHFDIANHDIYCPLKFGCSTVIIPSRFFTFPAELVSFIKKEKITAIFWVPYALCTVAKLRALEIVPLDSLRYIFFAGETMPVKQLNYWRKYVPDAQYVNMYGSTETHVCLYYKLDREIQDDEKLPIGQTCGNIDALVLDENGCLIPPGSEKMGELYIRGGAIALGYLNDQAQTEKRFVQNPLNSYHPERIYRTGDLVSYNAAGDLVYRQRLDHQIKHLGYRIELGEIEAAARGIAGIEDCACSYDTERKIIILFYTGVEQERKMFVKALSEKVPRYMLPGRFVHLREMIRNGNGKIDRMRLGELVKEVY